MIDLKNEQLIHPTEVASYLPVQKGKKLNVSTVYRWFQRGLAGYRLECVCVGGTRYTSIEAVNRFFARVTEAKTGLPQDPSAKVVRNRKQAAQELDAAGF